MKKSVSALGCIVWLLSTITVGASQQSKTNQPGQTPPDFSGKWVLDFGNSKLGRERALLRIVAVTLVISQDGPELTFTETTNYEGLEITQKMICYTDERGDTNPALYRYMLGRSRTRWTGSQLVTKSSRQVIRPIPEDTPSNDKLHPSRYDPQFSRQTSIDTRSYQGPYVIDTQFIGNTVRRELSADGRTLIITTSMRGPDGTHVIKQTFNRAT